MAKSSIIPHAPFAVKDLANATAHEVQTTTVGGVIQHVTTAESMVADATNDSKKSWWRRLFPNEVDRAKAEGELAMCRTEFDAVHKALIIVRTASIQTLEEAVNATLLKGKSAVRTDALAFVAEQVHIFMTRLNEAADKVAVDISARQRRAESADLIDEAREMILVQCREEVVFFKQLGDQALMQVKSLLDEQVRVGAL